MTGTGMRSGPSSCATQSDLFCSSCHCAHCRRSASDPVVHFQAFREHVPGQPCARLLTSWPALVGILVPPPPWPPSRVGGCVRRSPPCYTMALSSLPSCETQHKAKPRASFPELQLRWHAIAIGRRSPEQVEGELRRRYKSSRAQPQVQPQQQPPRPPQATAHHTTARPPHPLPSCRPYGRAHSIVNVLHWYSGDLAVCPWLG